MTLRVQPGLPSLRRDAVASLVRAVIARAGHRPDFRVVEFNLLGNHLHLIVEADGHAALSRGMHALTIRLALRINAHLGRRGALFATRYHARTLRTPREVHHALRYVLLNARHHAAASGRRLFAGWLDPFSSAPWFDAWLEPSRSTASWLSRLRALPRPTAQPTTWLLTTGWRRHGLLAVDDVPGASAV